MSRAVDRNQRSSEKGRAILDGAMQEFLTHGYAAASMDRLAIAAGVSKPTLYSYFENKEGLFKALIERMAQEKLQAVLNAQASPALEAETGVVLRQLADRLVETIAGDPQLLAFVRLIIGESGRFPALARSFILSIDQPVIAALSQHLALQSALPDSEAGARVVIGSLVYLVIVQEMLGGNEVLPIERDRLIDTLVHLFSSSMPQRGSPSD